MRFRLAHLLLISTVVCIAFAFPAWYSPVELLIIAPLLAFVVLNIERRTTINYRAPITHFTWCLILRAFVGVLVASIVFNGIATLLLAIGNVLPSFDLAVELDRRIFFWFLFGACVAVGYHIIRRYWIGKVEES